VQSPLGIEHLIRLLGDTDGQCRFAAQDALIRIGLPATEALMVALEGSDDEVTGRILEVASAMGDDRYSDWALALLEDPFNVNRAVAASVLASTGHQSAGPKLVALLNDSSDEVVLAAAAGLGKLAFWSGAAALEPLLSNPSWAIRKQAGMTLLSLGAPGAILLRVSEPQDGPASDMALHSLQLKSLSS
jgi:HEAT repeat protein